MKNLQLLLLLLVGSSVCIKGQRLPGMLNMVNEENDLTLESSPDTDTDVAGDDTPLATNDTSVATTDTSDGDIGPALAPGPAADDSTLPILPSSVLDAADASIFDIDSTSSPLYEGGVDSGVDPTASAGSDVTDAKVFTYITKSFQKVKSLLVVGSNTTSVNSLVSDFPVIEPVSSSLPSAAPLSVGPGPNSAAPGPDQGALPTLATDVPVLSRKLLTV